MNDWKKQLEELQRKNREAENVTDESLVIGVILYMPLDESDGIVVTGGYDTRNKYFTIIGFTPEGNALGSLLINSNINQNIIITDELRECQYPIKKKDYPAILDYNSYIDCSEIFEIKLDKIKQKGLIKGKLTDQDKTLIIDFLKETEVIEPKKKRRYGLI